MTAAIVSVPEQTDFKRKKSVTLSIGAASSRNFVSNVIPCMSDLSYKNMHFLITEQPKSETMEMCLKMFQDKNVKVLVRCCVTAQCEELFFQNHGIQVVPLFYPDGQFPSTDILLKWFALINENMSVESVSEKRVISVHCAAGLGRAPVLVAVALMERGMSYEEAITYVRTRRPGSFNSKQLEQLSMYQPKGVLKPKKKRLSKIWCVM